MDKRTALQSSLVSGLVCFFLWILFGLNDFLISELTPFGIFSFQLSISPSRALEVLEVWQSQGVIEQARLWLLLDYFLMISYGVWFAFIGKILCIKHRLFFPLLLLLVLIDAIENILSSMILNLTLEISIFPLPTIICVCKFILLFCAISCVSHVFFSKKLSLQTKKSSKY